MGGDNNDNSGIEIKVPITEYTKHIVKEAVTEAMKQHQDTCPLIKTVSDLSLDLWGNTSNDGIKAKVKTLEYDYKTRRENVNFLKRPLFSGIVGAVFVGFGFFLKGAWLWFNKKT